MSSSDLAISVRGLSKAYKIAHQAQHSTMGEALIHRLRHPFQRVERETFWALKDVSFDIRKGEVVGIIGRNGAGKSTLLKVLSRITEPTGGEIDLYGRVGSLLEVGTGFHPELTGRENIYLNGAILGMRKREIDHQFDAMVDFAEVEQFLDTPVKRYSSGMYVRLAFAVAAHLNPEILIVDEVLAVGDVQFQKKCLGKMQDVANKGRTVLFVSHHMQTINLLCSRGICMRNGSIAFSGDAASTIGEYLTSHIEAEIGAGDGRHRPGTGDCRFVFARPAQSIMGCEQTKEIRFRVERYRRGTGRMFLQARVVDRHGVELVQCDSRLVGVWLDEVDILEGQVRISSPWLKPGPYRVDLYIYTHGELVDHFENACRFEISPILPYPNSAHDGTTHCVVLSDFDWEVEAPQAHQAPVEALAFQV